MFNVSKSLIDAVLSVTNPIDLTEAMASGYDDEHAFVDVWNHAVNNPKHLESKAHLHSEIDNARKNPKHSLNFHNKATGFTGEKKPEHEEAYYHELHHAADSIHDIANHDSFKEAVQKRHQATVAGSSRGVVSDQWLKHNAKNSTSKADIHIGSHTVSLKKGDSQLMSAGKEETTATYDHAMRGMVKHGHASEKDHSEVMKHVSNVSKHIAGMKTSLTDNEKQEHKNRAQEIINDIHKKHPKLSRYVTYEAATGHGKFGTNQVGSARFLVTTRKGGAHIHDTEKEDIGHESTLSIPRVALPKGDGREGNVKLDYKVK